MFFVIKRHRASIRPICFDRVEFMLVKCAYATTINRAQGATLGSVILVVRPRQPA